MPKVSTDHMSRMPQNHLSHYELVMGHHSEANKAAYVILESLRKIWELRAGREGTPPLVYLEEELKKARESIVREKLGEVITPGYIGTLRHILQLMEEIHNRHWEIKKNEDKIAEARKTLADYHSLIFNWYQEEKNVEDSGSTSG